MLSVLDALLLFLVGHKAQAGYDIRQTFQTTPLVIFSDSPGAIYPALARIEERGLLSSRVEQGGRRRRLYARTPAGDAAFRDWLTTPLSGSAARRPELVALRYTMIDGVFGARAAQEYLRDHAAAQAREIEGIRDFLAGPGAAMPLAARDAVTLGIRLSETRLNWAREIAARSGEEDDDARNGTRG